MSVLQVDLAHKEQTPASTPARRPPATSEKGEVAAQPSLPAIESARVSDSGTAVVRVKPPVATANLVPLTYTVIAIPASGGEAISATGTGTTIVLEGLEPGGDYKIYVVVTVLGSMSKVTSGIVPTATTLAGAPKLSSLQPGDASIKATWTAPLDDGGSPIISYELTCTSSKGVAISGASQIARVIS